MGGVSTTQAAERAEPTDAANATTDAADATTDATESAEIVPAVPGFRTFPSRTAAAPPGSGCSRPPWPVSPSTAGRAPRSPSSPSARECPGGRPAPLPHPRGPVHRRGGVRRRGALHRAARPVPGGCRRPPRGGRGPGRPLHRPLFRAALHLWVAASNEEQLRPRVTELEARVGRETHRIAVELLAADESRPGVRETVQGLLDMSRGLGLANLLTNDGGDGNGWWRSGAYCWTRRWAEPRRRH